MDFLKTLQNVMAAAAFAEAGEFEAAIAFLEPLGRSRKTKVLLSIDSADIHPNLLQYAMNLCRRIGAGLEILHVHLPGRKKSRLGEFFKRCNVDYLVTGGQAGFLETVTGHVAGRRDIMLVILGMSGAAGGQPCGNECIEAMTRRLGCPVVVPEPT